MSRHGDPSDARLSWLVYVNCLTVRTVNIVGTFQDTKSNYCEVLLGMAETVTLVFRGGIELNTRNIKARGIWCYYIRAPVCVVGQGHELLM